MAKELVSVGILLLITAASFYGLTLVWVRTGRAGRVAAALGVCAAYAGLIYLVSLWASSGGWPEGMFYMMAVLFVAVPAVVVFAVILIVALFGGAGNRGHRTGMVVSLTVLGLAILMIAFNAYLRLAWYAVDMDSPDPRERAYAVLMLGQTRLKSAVPIVVEAARDEDPSVRKNAILSLASIDDTGALPTVREALSDEDAGVREMAVIAIVPLGRGGPEVTSDLKRMLDDPDQGVRKAAEEGLDTIDRTWRTGPDAPKAYREPSSPPVP